MKNKLLVLIFCVIALSVSNTVNAQNLPEDQINRFFVSYKNSPEKALDELFATNKWLTENQGDLNNVKVQLNNTLLLIGNYHGYEKISEIAKGESLIQLTYFGKYERQPLRFIFLFYKPNKEWRIQNFLFDDKILED